MTLLIATIIKNRKSMNAKEIGCFLIAIYFILTNIFLYFLFRDFQPICEPCLSNAGCPTCLSKEQYLLIYIGVTINILVGIFIYSKNWSSQLLPHKELSDSSL
jgi:low temperature requirement protein LtrA